MSTFDHVLGDKNATIKTLPDVDSMVRCAKLSQEKKQEIVNESGRARNINKLNLSGTFYEEDGFLESDLFNL